MNKFILILLFICMGCSKTEVVYKNVYIPIKCEIDIPHKPQKTQPISLWLTDVMTYVLELELALQICTGEMDE